MPLMEMTPRASRASVNAAIANRTKAKRASAAAFNANILAHQPRRSQSYRRLDGNTIAFPPRPVSRIMADFSYAQSARIPVTAVMAPSSRATQAPWKSAGDPGNQTAGEVMQGAMRNRLFETSAGLVVAEGVEDYAEEQSFWSQGSVADPMGNWMTVNDRSSANTVLDQSLQEYGGNQGMSGFAMDGLASYDPNNSLWSIAADIVTACTAITSNWAHPEYLSKTALANKMQTMGYPANQIDGLINMSLSVLAVLSPNTAAKLRAAPVTSGTNPGNQGGTNPGNQGGSNPPTKQASFFDSIPMWAYPVFGIGAFLLIKRFRTARAA